jgi:hypothetical protein
MLYFPQKPRIIRSVDMPNWEVFDRKARPSVKQPLVTLQASGTFSMNEASYDAIGRPDQVELLYDKDERIIGFRPATDESPHSYPIKPQQNGRTYQTGGRAFCAYYDIEHPKARRFGGELIDGVLAINLKGEATSAERASKGSKPKSGSSGRVELRAVASG